MNTDDATVLLGELAEAFGVRPSFAGWHGLLIPFSVDDGREAIVTCRAERLVFPTLDEFVAACQSALGVRVKTAGSPYVPNAEERAIGIGGIAAARDALRKSGARG